jgi:phosphatidylglycerophosphate synthase
MFDHLLRSLKDRLLARLAQLLRGVPPNALSVLALLFGLGAAAAAAQGGWRLGLALWLANRVTDGLDGTVARLSGTQSDFGGYLDILLDFVVYAAVPLGFVAQSSDPDVLRWAAVLEASFFVNACSWMYLSAVLEKRASGAQASGELTTVTMPPALIAGFETIVFFSLFFIWPAYVPQFFVVMATLVGVNVVQRLVWARRVL